MFFGSAVVVILFCIFGGFFTDTSASVFEAAQKWVSTNLGGYDMVITSGFLLFTLWLGLGPFRKVKLGPPDSKPDYSTLSWLCMLFSAGMGVGIVFWGVAEPISHFTDPPFAQAESQAAVGEAMRYSFFSLGTSPLGDLHYSGRRTGLLSLSPQIAACSTGYTLSNFWP